MPYRSSLSLTSQFLPLMVSWSFACMEGRCMMCGHTWQGTHDAVSRQLYGVSSLSVHTSGIQFLVSGCATSALTKEPSCQPQTLMFVTLIFKDISIRRNYNRKSMDAIYLFFFFKITLGYFFFFSRQSLSV